MELFINADPDENKYSGYGIGFDARGSVLLSDGKKFGKNVIIFGTDMSPLTHIDNKKKDISGIKFQKSVCNGCPDLLVLYLNISDITIITVKGIVVVLFMTFANLVQLT